MLIVPIQSVDHKQDALLVILDATNIERMGQADPAEIELSKCGKELINPIILICLEKPTAEFNKVVQGGDVNQLIKFLRRGWEFRPDKGDHDRGPESISKGN